MSRGKIKNYGKIEVSDEGNVKRREGNGGESKRKRGIEKMFYDVGRKGREDSQGRFYGDR